MQENIEFNELETTLTNIRILTEKLTRSVNNVNILIQENVNSGIGVWDAESAAGFRKRWDTLMEEVPLVLETFKSQETNLEQVVQNMKTTEESR